VRLDGRPLGIASVAARNVLLLVDSLPFLYLVGWVTMVLSRRRQRIGDLVAGTVVCEAATHPHMPAFEKGRTLLLFGYPTAWLASAIVAIAVLQASTGQTYAADVSRLCAGTQASMGELQTPAQIRNAGLAVADLEHALATIDPPAGMSSVHARLLAAEHQFSADLRGIASARTSAGRHLRAERFAAHADAAHRELAGVGLDACL
jgi:hypothetical protein